MLWNRFYTELKNVYLWLYSFSSPSVIYASSAASSSSIFAWDAMTPTMAKQMTIPRSSSFIIGSLSHTRAIIEIQKGFVCQQTITKDNGAIDTPKFIKKKLIWPEVLRINNVYFFYIGKSLNGLYPAIRHQITATGNPARVRSKTNSVGLNPELCSFS